MKIIATVGLVLLASVSGWAQITSPVQAVPLPVFNGGSNTVLDGSGDLFIFESGRSTTGVTITGLRHSFYPPQTQVSVLRAGSSTTSETYTNTSIQVIGTGTSAIYAIATVYTISGTTVTSSQSLIAILPGQPLPASLSGFPSQTLSSRAEVKLGPSDYISVVTESAATSTTAATRTATVYHFVPNGGGTFGSFTQVSSGTLP